VQKVFELLSKFDLVVSEKKCTWGRKELLFLGHIVDGKGINVDGKKIDKITSWPTPKSEDF
jgi:hypothetical protein